MAVRVVINRAGVRQLLRDPRVADLMARGHRIQAAAGPGHSVELYIGHNRARVTVRTETYAAMRSEATSRTLTRAIDAGR